jgi:hypothetical protein
MTADGTHSNDEHAENGVQEAPSPCPYAEDELSLLGHWITYHKSEGNTRQ